MKNLAAYIMRGRMQAMTVASTLALLSLLLPPVSIVSSAAVALITLRRGGNEGLYVLFCSCLSVALLGFFLLGSFQFALMAGLALWLPVWVISIVLREGKDLSFAVEMAVLLGILGVIGFYMFSTSAVWQPLMNDIIQLWFSGRTDVSADDVEQIVLMSSRYMTGVMITGTVLGLLFGLFLARWWQAALYNPGGFRKEYLSLRVHPKVAMASIGIVAIALLIPDPVSEICWNIAIPFVAMYALVGTAILHAAFSMLKTRRFMIPFLYITLVLIRFTIIIVVIVGIVDVWMDLRSKFSNKTRT